MDPQTKRQIAIENGKKSRGPKTAAGKAISSRNAVKYGFAARSILLEGESPKRFAAVAAAIHEEFAPQTPAENAAVDAMIFARWRQMRIWTMEKVLVDSEIRVLGHLPSDNDPGIATCSRATAAFRNLAQESSALALFHRYETSYDRQFSRALRRFVAIRDARLRFEKLNLPNEPTGYPFESVRPVKIRTANEPQTNPKQTESEPATNPVQTNNEPDPQAARPDAA